MNQESGIKAKKNKIISIIHDSPACSRLRRQPMAGRLFMIHSGGFTLIELMIVISLMALLGTLSIVGFASYNKTLVLQTSANEVAALLNLAKSRAQSQVKPSGSCSAVLGYTVKIAPPGSYSLYARCSDTTDQPVDEKNKNLSSGLSFNSEASYFFFPIRTGEVQPTDSLGTKLSPPWEIVVADSGGKTKTITVNALGGVSVQ